MASGFNWNGRATDARGFHKQPRSLLSATSTKAVDRLTTKPQVARTSLVLSLYDVRLEIRKLLTLWKLDLRGFLAIKLLPNNGQDAILALSDYSKNDYYVGSLVDGESVKS